LDARKAIANGINPAEQKQHGKRAMLAAHGNVYEVIAAKWFEAEKAAKSKSWIDNNERWLKLVNKTLGKKPIGSIAHDDCYNAVRPLEEQGYAFSAERARQQIAQVFAFAIRKRLHSGGNPARDLKGEIKVPEHKNNVHIKAREIPEFLKAVDGSSAASQTKIASRLLLLTSNYPKPVYDEKGQARLIERLHNAYLARKYSSPPRVCAAMRPTLGLAVSPAGSVVFR
jgi:hypothetical protein